METTGLYEMMTPRKPWATKNDRPSLPSLPFSLSLSLPLSLSLFSFGSSITEHFELPFISAFCTLGLFCMELFSVRTFYFVEGGRQRPPRQAELPALRIKAAAAAIKLHGSKKPIGSCTIRQGNSTWSRAQHLAWVLVTVSFGVLVSEFRTTSDFGWQNSVFRFRSFGVLVVCALRSTYALSSECPDSCWGVRT